jgi:cell division initiation protein
MDLTPLDVKKQEFKRVVRGYDSHAVRRFLDEVADAWEELIRKRESLHDRITELEATIENYRRVERTLNETLLAAQRIAEESRETALKEAEIVRKEAEMEARRVVDRAEGEARLLREQARELRVERDGLFLRLRNLIEDELLRLHALRDAHGDLPGTRLAEASLAPPETSELRPLVPPPAGARDLLHRLRQPAERPAEGAELGRREPVERQTSGPR